MEPGVCLGPGTLGVAVCTSGADKGPGAATLGVRSSLCLVLGTLGVAVGPGTVACYRPGPGTLGAGSTTGQLSPVREAMKNSFHATRAIDCKQACVLLVHRGPFWPCPGAWDNGWMSLGCAQRGPWPMPIHQVTARGGVNSTSPSRHAGPARHGVLPPRIGGPSRWRHPRNDCAMTMAPRMQLGHAPGGAACRSPVGLELFGWGGLQRASMQASGAGGVLRRCGTCG